MAFEGAADLPASKLTASIRVDDAAGDVAAASDGILNGLDDDSGLHPVQDRVAHDLAGADVLDRTKVELALAGAVLVISVRYNSSRFSAAKIRCTRSLNTGGPGFLVFLRDLTIAAMIPAPWQSRSAVRSAIGKPAWAASSASSRYPNSGPPYGRPGGPQSGRIATLLRA